MLILKRKYNETIVVECDISSSFLPKSKLDEPLLSRDPSLIKEGGPIA